MPLYLFKCENCRREFEELVKFSEEKSTAECPGCGREVKREVAAPFGVSTKLNPKQDTIYSRKEIDKVVGEASAKSWEGYDQRWNSYYKRRREERRANKQVKEVTIKPGSNGKISPFEHLGTKKEREFRKEYGKEYNKQITEQKKDSETPVVMKKIL